ncbi:hypothetical protein ACFX13_003507 [Malus domestica]
MMLFYHITIDKSHSGHESQDHSPFTAPFPFLRDLLAVFNDVLQHIHYGVTAIVAMRSSSTELVKGL